MESRISKSRKPSGSKISMVRDVKLVTLEKTPVLDPHQEKLKKKKEK